MKMQSVERLALIILAIILAAWALVLMLRKDNAAQPDLSAIPPDTVIITDTVFIPHQQKPHTHTHRPPSHQQASPTPSSSPMDNIIQEPPK